MLKRTENIRAFTIIELSIVIAIIAIVTALAMPIFPNLKTNNAQLQLTSYENEMQKALAQYYIQYGTQVKQIDDASATVITTDNTDLTTWMQTLHNNYNIIFRAGYTYQYENTGLFGTVTIEEN